MKPRLFKSQKKFTREESQPERAPSVKPPKYLKSKGVDRVEFGT